MRQFANLVFGDLTYFFRASVKVQVHGLKPRRFLTIFLMAHLWVGSVAAQEHATDIPELNPLGSFVCTGNHYLKQQVAENWEVFRVEPQMDTQGADRGAVARGDATSDAPANSPVIGKNCYVHKYPDETRVGPFGGIITQKRESLICKDHILTFELPLENIDVLFDDETEEAVGYFGEAQVTVSTRQLSPADLELLKSLPDYRGLWRFLARFGLLKLNKFFVANCYQNF